MQLIFETIDGKKQQVGHEQRAKCKYCSTDIKCGSSFIKTSALKRHIENVCKLHPGRANLEEGQQVFSSDGVGNSKVTMVQWTQEAAKSSKISKTCDAASPANSVNHGKQITAN